MIQDELFKELTIDDMYEKAKRRQKQQSLPDLKAKVSAMLDRVLDRGAPDWDVLDTSPLATPDRRHRPAD
jgi:hypothetical protein